MALSKATNTVKDGTGTPVTVVSYSDGTNVGPALAVLGANGTNFLPSGDAVGREIYVLVTSAAYGGRATVTRPANTTAYAAGDVVGGAFSIATMGPSGGFVILNSAQLVISSVTAVPSGMTSFRLYLYNVTPPSAIADNGAFDLPTGDLVAYMGLIDLGTITDIGSQLLTVPVNPALQVKLSTQTVFAYLVTNGGFTPAANSEVYTPMLTGVAP